MNEKDLEGIYFNIRYFDKDTKIFCYTFLKDLKEAFLTLDRGISHSKLVSQ